MSHRAIKTDRAPAAIGPYSQAIQAGAWLFVSGQIGLKPETGQFVSEVFADQARQCLENMSQILAAAGCKLDDVVSVDVFITDISLFGLFNEIYSEYFSAHKPARAVVEAKGLPKGALVEIKCVAMRAA